ncbi:TPA: hypothetical protein SAY52_005506 [Burkholderia cenocepacia]|nr:MULTISPECIES: hypothetical protein [unclassified Burkholderia]HEF5874827.1 hypothetical protein [Burkholderia cenocepacia]
MKYDKNNAADAREICEVVAIPDMRFGAISNIEQLAVLALHRADKG